MAERVRNGNGKRNGRAFDFNDPKTIAIVAMALIAIVILAAKFSDAVGHFFYSAEKGAQLEDQIHQQKVEADKEIIQQKTDVAASQAHVESLLEKQGQQIGAQIKELKDSNEKEADAQRHQIEDNAKETRGAIMELSKSVVELKAGQAAMSDQINSRRVKSRE